MSSQDAHPAPALLHRWENPAADRYYEARLTRDLFGQAVILRTWGRVGSPLGGSQVQPLPDSGVALALQRIAARRKARGYQLVPLC